MLTNCIQNIYEGKNLNRGVWGKVYHTIRLIHKLLDPLKILLESILKACVTINII